MASTQNLLLLEMENADTVNIFCPAISFASTYPFFFGGIGEPYGLQHPCSDCKVDVLIADATILGLWS